jgi:hypothetical protein
MGFLGPVFFSSIRVEQVGSSGNAGDLVPELHKSNIFFTKVGSPD